MSFRDLEPAADLGMEWCCGLLFVGVIVVVFGHFVWEAAEAILRAMFGSEPAPAVRRVFRYCPACSAEPAPGARYCPKCDLDLDGKLAMNLHRVHVAEREVQALLDGGQLDQDAARPVLDQLEARARSLRGLPAKPKRAPLPVAAVVQPLPLPEPVAPADAVEQIPARDDTPEAPLPELIPIPEPSDPLPPVLAALEVAEPIAPPPTKREPKRAKPVTPLPPPDRRTAGFLEAHNILWGELVGGLLIVGCSIALVVTLRQTLEAIPYFRFLLSAAITFGLFGAGQYTLHRWKLSGTSRGMLVISMLLMPLTLLLLAEPFTAGTQATTDAVVKVLALAAFVGVVRTGGRDLIGTEHLPGPIDRRWLLALAVVGAAGTQLLPANLALAWAPLVCFAVATGAALGGLSWYHPSRRDAPVSDQSGTALLVFVGLAAFALVAAWGLFVARAPAQLASRLADLAVPLALASIPVIEAGVLVLRRVASGGLRTAGTAVALAGFGAATTGLALAWPDPLALLLISGSIGAYLTRVAFRERLPWVQAGAIGLLALATVLGFHGIVGNWDTPSALDEKLGSSTSGCVLAGFALALGLLAEVLARRASRQTRSYATGALCVGATGLLLVSWHGAEQPVTAAAAHFALALGLLASNYRWERRSLAHAGLWAGLVGTLWALWAQAPRQPDVWGFVLTAEAALLALGAVALRNAHRGATALLRRAGSDVAFAACALSVVIAASSLTLDSAWHTGTLFGLALTGVALARLTGWPALTWVGSSAALLGCLHLGVFTWDARPEALAIETAFLAHATLATGAALLFRRRARVFGEPFRWSARLSTALAVPLLFVPAAGYAFASAGLAVWLGVLWLAFTLLWRERNGFSAFQAAVTLAALLAAFGWTEQQDWWPVTQLRLLDPRALHAFGFALAGLAVVWVVARRAFLPNARSRELWGDNPLSIDRCVLGAIVIAFVLLGAVAVLPGVSAELTASGSRSILTAPSELTHAFDPTALYLLALLAAAVALSWRLSKLEHDTDVHAIGLVLLAVAAPVIWAGTFAPEIATASALRWGLAVVFVAGSALVALRAQLRHAAERVGFAVRPAPHLRPTLLGMFAATAGVVLLLSALVAELGLSRLKPTGPLEVSAFAQMGVIASNLVPLALVIFGLSISAARERSSGYALAGGLVFVVTLVAGYALAVVTAGNPLDGTELTRLALICAGAAAAWAVLWQAVEWRVPGGYPLTVQVLLGFGALLAVCFVPGAHVFVSPHLPLTATFDPLGVFGGCVLVLVTGAGVWHARRTQPEMVSPALAVAGSLVGVLAAVAVRSLDEPDRWVSFHTMALTWAGVGVVFLATMARVRLGASWLACFASLLVLCALRAGWSDPWRPWLPSGLALTAAFFFGAVALRTRTAGFAGVSGLAVNLAVVLVWVTEAPDSVFGFCLANAAGFGIAVAVWAGVRLRKSTEWLEPLDFAILPAFAFLLLGLAPHFGGVRNEPLLLTWGATSAVALACAIGLWDRRAALAPPGVFTIGALAVLLAVCEADPRAVWEVPATALALGAYALGVGLLSRALARHKPLLGMQERGDSWPWLLIGLPVLALVAGVFGLRSGLTSTELLSRGANPAAMALLAVSFATLSRVYSENVRAALHTTSAALAVWSVAATGWAIPAPDDPHVWLHRNAWLFVALAFTAVGGSVFATRLAESWQRAVQTVAGWVAVAALVVLCLNLLQQIPVFDPVLTRRTPLGRDASLAMLGAIGGLIVLALRFALKPERDPFELRPAHRTAYVYLAEALVVLFFLQIRFNVPELFLGNLAKLWTFAVMALAYAGIGLAELFERRKIDVLALPLRRTGVLLPLVPLLAFWVKPPAAVSEFARDTAPGLGPLLGYLEKLPQHFDTYAWLWFLAGGVYGFVALSKRSFGWALLAALATNAALWSLLAHGDVPFFVHPQAWVIPLALIVLVSEHINRHRLSEEVSNGMRYAGVAMIYVASAADMFIAGVGTSMWLPVVLAVLCVLGVLGGILLRVRAFIYLGLGFLLLDVFSMIWHAAVNLQQTWVWYASGIVLGAVVLALFAYLEKRRGHADKEPNEGE